MANKFNYTLRDHRVTYEAVDLTTLQISELAQRGLKIPHYTKMARNFVREAVGTLVVSQRSDGQLFLVDGQHRREACLAVGIKTLVVEMHHGLTEQEEGLLFLLKNRESIKPDRSSEYKIAVTAALPEFVATEEVLEKRGLKVRKSASANVVGACTTVVDITQKYGPDVLERVLIVAENAWGREGTSWSASLLAGLGMFLGRHGDRVDDKALAARLARLTALQWLARVTALCTNGGGGGGIRTKVFYGLVVQEWNKRRTTNRIDE